MSGSRRGGERVLESRHLIGLFLGVVLLCCVFFTLGYVMGKTQYGNSPVQAATLDPVNSLPRSTSPAPAQPSSTEFDFYTEKKTTDVPLRPAGSGAPARVGSSGTAGRETTASAKSVWPSAPIESAPPAPSPWASVNPAGARTESSIPKAARHSAPVPSRYRAPRMSRNAVVLQVGALRRESDALTMADVLQRKGFPAFVVVPTADSFYRVQVGPFPTAAIGERAKQSLRREGFKAIYRR